MGWFLWGVAFGWAMCGIFYAAQKDGDRSNDGATIICIGLIIIALVISIGLGVSSGVIPASAPTATPLLGR